MQADGSREAIASLRNILRGYGSVAVAFSGGVDSSLLLQVALMTLDPEHVLALYVRSDLVKESDCSQAITWLQSLQERCQLNYQIIAWQPLSIPAIRDNSSLRCYHCKHQMFTLLQPLQRQHGLAELIDGTNADDLQADRPGLLAARELGVCSPLADAGCSKSIIRHISRRLHLPTWNKASASCLATRIPTDCRLSTTLLSRIALLEKTLEDMGYLGCRVRVYPEQPDAALLELDPLYAKAFDFQVKNTVVHIFHGYGISRLEYRIADKSRLL